MRPLARLIAVLTLVLMIFSPAMVMAGAGHPAPGCAMEGQAHHAASPADAAAKSLGALCKAQCQVAATLPAAAPPCQSTGQRLTLTIPAGFAAASLSLAPDCPPPRA